MPGRDDNEAADGMFDELRAIYARVDRALAELGGACAACGTCCTFPPGSPVLYATRLERDLLSSVPHAVDPARGGDVCPYLDVSTSSCTARERRTLGCRTHFCSRAMPDPAARERAHSICEGALTELGRIVSRATGEWEYAPVIECFRGKHDASTRGRGTVSGASSAPRPIPPPSC